MLWFLLQGCILTLEPTNCIVYQLRMSWASLNEGKVAYEGRAKWR